MTTPECDDCHAPAGTVCSDVDCPGRPKGAPTLEAFCNVANDLYAAPTEERFYAVVNMARELLAQASMRWDDGYQFGRSEVDALQAANAALVCAIDMIRETLDGGDVQDLRQIINAALAKHRAHNDRAERGA